MPDKPIADIDHLLTYVHDLDAAASLYGRMGFTLSPISRIGTMGISNRLVLMRPLTPGCANFIELMAAHDRLLLPPSMARVLSGAEGPKSMVLGVEDAAVAHAAMVRLGHDVPPPLHVKREWVIGPGQSVFPEFDVVLPTDGALVFNCCRYVDVAVHLREDWLRHPNGAQRLGSVLAVADDPGLLARQFGGLFGSHAHERDGCFSVSPGKVAIEILPTARARERYGLDIALAESGARYLGCEIEVSSLDLVRLCLDRGRVEHRASGGAILVEPSTALGNLIVFQAEGAP